MISTKAHAVIDYAYGALLLIAPYLLGFAHDATAEHVLMAFGIGAIVYSLLTNYELSAVKLIPMPAHLILDVVAGLALIALAWVLQTSDKVRWAYVIFGAASVVVPMFTARHPKRQ